MHSSSSASEEHHSTDDDSHATSDSSHATSHGSSHGSSHSANPSVFALGSYFDYDIFIVLLSIVGGSAMVSVFFFVFRRNADGRNLEYCTTTVVLYSLLPGGARTPHTSQ